MTRPSKVFAEGSKEGVIAHNAGRLAFLRNVHAVLGRDDSHVTIQSRLLPFGPVSRNTTLLSLLFALFV